MSTIEVNKPQIVECPGCKEKFELEVKQKTPKVIIEQQETTRIKEIEESKEVAKPKLLVPSDEPFYPCKDCDTMHKNPNYRQRPNKKCENCGSHNGPNNKTCKNCSSKEFEEIDEDALDELGIPRVENGSTHEHE